MDNIELFEKVLLRCRTDYFPPLISPDGWCFFYGGEACVSMEKMARFLAYVTATVREKGYTNIVIALGEADFCDKLLYVVLESYIEHLICKYGTRIKVAYYPKTNITTKGITSSPLQLLKDGSEKNNNKFLARHRFDIYGIHYRKLFEAQAVKNETWLSRALTEISYFLKANNVPADACNNISEVAVELVGNAVDHACTDCILDIDIADNYYKRGVKASKKYFGANICVLDFSSKLLGTQLQEKLCVNPAITEDKTPRYAKLMAAYQTHMHFFDDNYTEEDFFILSAFQNRISGRPFGSPNGGTGLTRLIRSLETQSEAHNCYAISGNRKISFIPEYLEYDGEDWIGMNASNDFFHFKPGKGVFSKNSIYFPGTAFNLNFVIAKENAK